MVDSPALQPFAERATELLVQFAQDGDPGVARAYDELLFNVLFGVVRRRGASLAAPTGDSLGVSLWVPAVSPGDVEAISVNVTVAALQAARRTASRFDPSRGDGASWALGAARFAYVDTVRSFYDARRRGTTVPVDPVDITELADASTVVGSPERVVEVRAALQAALATLTHEERVAVLGQSQYGMSYAEISTYMYGNAASAKRVDRLLQAARLKLAEFERNWNEESS